MTRLSATDALFLYADSPTAPMNMGSVQILKLPKDRKDDFFEDFRRFVGERLEYIPKLKTRIVEDVLGLPYLAPVDEFDLDYHVRRTRLKSSDDRELFRKIGRIQHRKFDPDKPQFAFYLIEGLKDGRVAVVQKFHHALADGKTAVRIMDLFSDQGLERATKSRDETDADGLPGKLRRIVTGGLEDIRRTAASLSGMVGVAGELLGEDGRAMLQQLKSRPRTIFNQPLSEKRQFAMETWPMQQLTDVRKAAGLTFNEIGLVLLAGALRRYLDEIDALPDESLVCNVPVAIQASGSDSGNAVLAMWIPIGTHLEDRSERIRFVREQTEFSKRLIGKVLENVSAGQGVQLPSVIMKSMGRSLGSSWMARLTQPPGNIAMSSVPAPATPISVAGAEVESLYGLPMILHGQAVSTTFSSYANSVVMSILCCEEALPDPERVFEYMREELDTLAADTPKKKKRRATPKKKAAKPRSKRKAAAA